jgi:AraC-like DNA-binding protein
VNIKSKNIQTDIKNASKHTKSTNDLQPLMLKMVTSYSVFLFIILILFFYLFNSGAKSAQAQYKWQAKSTLMSNVELFEKDLNIMDVYCRQLLQNSSFRKLSGIDDTDDKFMDLGYSLATSLSTDVYPESLLPISEVYCYLPDSGYILAPSYFITQDRYYNWIKRYSSDMHENWLKALTNSDNFYHFILLDEYMPSINKSYYMYIINLNDLNYMDINAVVCFVFEKDKLASLFECMNSDTDYRYLSVRISPSDSILSLSTDESANFDNLISDGLLESVNKYFKSIGVSLDIYTSGTTGYSYYFSYPAYETTTNFALPQILYIVLFIAALLGGLLLIFILSKRNMQPIIELDMQLHATEQEKSHLQDVMDTQRPIIFSSYVRQLLKGLIVSDEEASYAKEFLGLTDGDFVYNSLYIVAYNNINTEDYPSDDLPESRPRSPEECNRIIMDAITRYIGENPYCFSPSDRAYALILAVKKDNADDLIIRTNEIIVKMHDYLLDTYGIWLFAGIGKNTDDLVNVWESYQQAMEAVNYTSKNYIFFPYEFIKKDSSAFYYPTELSTKLIHFITTGNTPQVMELFNLLHQENIEERSLPINMLQFLLSDIRNTLLKARFALPPETPKDKIESLDECFSQHVTFKLCEDIALRLCKLFTAETDDSNLVSAIERYIKENYADPSMGLNKISDEFQISESYFSHMFKEKTGVNFSTYLENIRMHEAARLIKETDTGLNELYILVGYNNANSFRRAFKKVYGVTPSAMRG